MIGMYTEELDSKTVTNLKKTIPDLSTGKFIQSGWGLLLRVDKAPFTDIRVRQALQKAVDLKTIASIYYGSEVEGVPWGMVGPTNPGCYTPYDEWPKEVKEGYTYDPVKAKKLLADAGYSNGFKTNIVTSATYDIDLLQIAKSYLAVIGVDMEIKTMEYTNYVSLINNRGYDAMIWRNVVGSTTTPDATLSFYTKGHTQNYWNISDPFMDKGHSKLLATLDQQEYKKASRELDDYVIKNQWSVSFMPISTYSVFHPWFKGYSGEMIRFNLSDVFAHIWIDKGVKKSNGY